MKTITPTLTPTTGKAVRDVYEDDALKRRTA